MIQPHQKSQEVQIAFKKKFAEIVKNNPILKDNYSITFAEISPTVTHFYITDKEGKSLEVIKLMSKREYSEYVDLLNSWKQ
jgi:hypothetical protein